MLSCSRVPFPFSSSHQPAAVWQIALFRARLAGGTFGAGTRDRAASRARAEVPQPTLFPTPNTVSAVEVGCPPWAGAGMGQRAQLLGFGVRFPFLVVVSPTF